MATIPHEPSGVSPERRRWALRVLVSEMWASLAIAVMWLSVLVDAVFGPDIVTTSSGGSDTARVPSAIAVALFAYLATRVVARYGFGHRREKALTDPEDVPRRSSADTLVQRLQRLAAQPRVVELGSERPVGSRREHSCPCRAPSADGHTG